MGIFQTTNNKFYHLILICISLSLLEVFIIQKSTVVYVPLLFPLLSGFLYGFLEPKKGWILAIIQIVVLTGGYFFLKKVDYTAQDQEIAKFATFTSIFPSLFAPLLASIIRRM